MNQIKPIKLKAKTYWANLLKENEMSGKFQVDISNLSDNAVRALEDMGIEVKNKGDDRGFFVSCKSKHPIRAYDTSGNELKDVLVGNGSDVTCTISAYDWTFKNKKGRSPSLIKLVVTNLISFNADADDAETVDELNDDLQDVL